MFDTVAPAATGDGSADGLSLLLDPELDAFGASRTVTRGTRLAAGRRGVLTIVRSGVVCRTTAHSGVCAGLVRAGEILESETRLGGPTSHGWWMSDGVVRDIPLAALEERYGRDVRQDVSELWLSQQLAASRTTLVCAVRHRGAQRIAGWVAALAEADGVARIAQGQLAAMAGLQRTSVCALLADLAGRGAVRVGRGKVAVHDRNLLLAESCGCAARLDRN
jgi:CRP-like cAMP-binding protein